MNGDGDETFEMVAIYNILGLRGEGGGIAIHIIASFSQNITVWGYQIM